MRANLPLDVSSIYRHLDDEEKEVAGSILVGDI